MVEKLSIVFMNADQVDPLFSELQADIDQLRMTHLTSFFFQGQENHDWDTRSTLARRFPDLTSEQFAAKEQDILGEIRKKYAGTLYESTASDNRNNWYTLMQAQHLFEPTRLLDWTPDWIRSLFFVLEDGSQDEQDGAILYTPTNINIIDNEALDELDPFSLNRVVMICPTTYLSDEFPIQLGTRRIYRQIGKFLVVPYSVCKVPLEETYDGYFGKIRIPYQNKKRLRAELKRRGITVETMYQPKFS